MPLLGSTPPRQDLWTRTSWSTLATIAETAPREAEGAWNDLIARYRTPLLLQARRLLTRARGRPVPAEDAEDLVQAFWVACLDKDWLGRADPDKGRFRAFVQVLLKRFVRDRVEHEHAGVRHPGPGRGVAQLEDLAREPAAPGGAGDDDEAFDREWVRIAIERAIADVEAASARDGVVLRDLIRTDGKGSADLAAVLRVHPQQLAVIKTRVRDRFAKHFTNELAATVRDASDFDAEWRALARYLP